MVRIRGGKSASSFAISSCFLCRLSFFSLSNLACVLLLSSHPLSLLRPLICSSVSDSDPISSRSIVLTLSTVSLIGKLQIYLCPVTFLYPLSTWRWIEHFGYLCNSNEITVSQKRAGQDYGHSLSLIL